MTTRPSKRLRATYVASALAFVAFGGVVAVAVVAPDAVGAVAGAYATLAAMLGGGAGAYTYSEGRRPSAGGGEWAGPAGPPAGGGEDVEAS